jgi:hypothetical protein
VTVYFLRYEYVVYIFADLLSNSASLWFHSQGIRSFKQGDKVRSQQQMRLRVAAQAFTLVALAGSAYINSLSNNSSSSVPESQESSRSREWDRLFCAWRRNDDKWKMRMDYSVYWSKLINLLISSVMISAQSSLSVFFPLLSHSKPPQWWAILYTTSWSHTN